MTSCAPIDQTPPAFHHERPARSNAIILTSPHSGRHYPANLLGTARLDATALRRSEDAFIDQLIGAGPSLGMEIFCATHARAYLDVNRDPSELDPSLFHDPPVMPKKPSDRVQAGLGVLPRVVGVGLDIYPRRIDFAQAQQRISAIHIPYHDALTQLVAEAKAIHGYAVMLDWHSMPSGAVAHMRAHGGKMNPAIVLGDLNGRACAPQITEAVLHAFERRGYAVSVNEPYAGGYTTQRYGKPFDNCHVLQIELDRGLYMDELRIKPHGGFAGLRDVLTSLLGELAGTIPALALGRRRYPMAAE